MNFKKEKVAFFTFRKGWVRGPSSLEWLSMNNLYFVGLSKVDR